MKSLFFVLFMLATNPLFALSMPAPGACPMNYSPVCGADGKTYSNSCVAQNAGVSFRPGECQTQRPPQHPQDCINCGGNPMLGASPMPFWQNHMPLPFPYRRPMPWWGYYGQQRYPNFHYPGVWSGYGMNPTPYPGNGGAFAAKPNVYLDSKDGDEFKLEVKFTKHSAHLVSSPDLSLGWEVEYVGKRNIKHLDGYYEYLFYDFRFDESLAQFEKGFCTDAHNLVEEMIKILKTLGYSLDEQDDFREHWNVKIPYANKYCVYPQLNAQLDPIVPLKASIKVKNEWRELLVQRVLFIVHLSDEGGVFPPGPKTKFSAPKPTSAIKVREWGVAFLSDQSHKN